MNKKPYLHFTRTNYRVFSIHIFPTLFTADCKIYREQKNVCRSIKHVDTYNCSRRNHCTSVSIFKSVLTFCFFLFFEDFSLIVFNGKWTRDVLTNGVAYVPNKSAAQHFRCYRFWSHIRASTVNPSIAFNETALRLGHDPTFDSCRVNRNIRCSDAFHGHRRKRPLYIATMVLTSVASSRISIPGRRTTFAV